FYGPSCGTPANQSVWIAFLAKRGVTSSTDGYCGLSLFDSGATAPGGNGCSTTEKVFIGKRSGATTWGFEFADGSGNGISTSGAFDLTMRLIVVRLDFSSSTYNVRMWVDPLLSRVPQDGG